MIKKIKSGISTVWDFYRTAPFGETSALILSHYAFEAFKKNLLLEGSLIVISAVFSVWVARDQFKLKKRLEDHIEDHGFTSEGFETTIPTWCGRQTARVVAEKHNCLDEYVKLCEQYKGTMSYRFLPHI
ncbi:hypothetical protein HZA97_06550 [Candidatus Woesearchaeota archaeon]|nr:hypothetical protein [Candidatus Woesearchaeota archaeon]